MRGGGELRWRLRSSGTPEAQNRGKNTTGGGDLSSIIINGLGIRSNGLADDGRRGLAFFVVFSGGWAKLCANGRLHGVKYSEVNYDLGTQGQRSGSSLLLSASERGWVHSVIAAACGFDSDLAVARSSARTIHQRLLLHGNAQPVCGQSVRHRDVPAGVPGLRSKGRNRGDFLGHLRDWRSVFSYDAGARDAVPGTRRMCTLHFFRASVFHTGLFLLGALQDGRSG